MVSRYSNKVDLRGDGRIILYKREDLKQPKWQVRIRVPNASGYKTVSSKTDNFKEAERFALNLYEELFLHVRAGGSIQSRTFRQVFEAWRKSVRTMGHTPAGGSWEGTIERIESYALKFFGPMKIDQIGPKEFSDFWVWRKSNFTRRRPSNGTLRRERTSILPVFKFAVTQGYLASVPETNPPRSRTERRPTFTQSEWEQICTKATQWVRDGEALATWRHRFLTQQYILILANTGLRVGEARGLRWTDLRTVPTGEGPRLIAEVRGKTGVREVVFQDGADRYVKQIYDLRTDELGSEPPSDEVIFCHKDGSQIQTMKTAFRSLLTFARVPIERNGRARTIYSLRHLYATMRLSDNISPFLLAKQMGTSVEMLEKFYGQTVSSELAAQITRVERKKAPVALRRAYPFE